MCDERIDELSVMTYLSQFPYSKLNQDVTGSSHLSAYKHYHSILFALTKSIPVVAELY